MLAAELCVQAYNMNVLRMLVKRWDSDKRAKKKEERLQLFLTGQNFDEDQRQGLLSLCYYDLDDLIKAAPHVVKVRRPNADGQTRNGQTHFQRYNTGL